MNSGIPQTQDLGHETKITSYKVNKKMTSQPRLTCQTCDHDHETEITPHKANRNRLWNSIPNKPIVEG